MSSALEALQAQVAILGQEPVLQGVLVALSTFILEDPVTITSGLLVADGRMGFLTALLGLSLGIAVGDLGLYAIGRFLGPTCIERGWISAGRIERARTLVERNLCEAVLLSRFMPGTRIPTYVGAGFVRASAAKFFLIALVASTIWAAVLLVLTVNIGAAVLPLLGEYRWWLVLGLLGVFLAVRLLKRPRALETSSDSGEPIASPFEFWPPYVFYIPVFAYYMWLALKYRSLTLPTAANPSIYSGGMILESKSQILSLVPPEFDWAVCRVAVLDAEEGNPPPKRLLSSALDSMKACAIEMPIVAKPDIGQRGAGVRMIRTEGELEEYLGALPASVPVILQELADFPHETGILYVRRPGEERGRITSVTLKEFPFVTGDGASTLRELIVASPRLKLVRKVYFKRHAARLGDVLPAGERFNLVFAGNHCQGAIFRDGAHIVTDAMTSAFDDIAKSMKDFHFGRFDVRFEALAEFQRGTGFKIVEINGAGAEATHIWDPAATLSGAWRTLFDQFRTLFEIGAANRARGHRPLGPVQFLRDALHYRRLSRDYPATT